MNNRSDSHHDEVAHLLNRQMPSRLVHSAKDRERFRALLDLARDGDQDAIGDLFREFNFEFEKEGGRHD